ncbi:NUDIX domain-containing protein [Altererythrobacter sp. ZODW24]|uniref:NUDIX hydrolase n=1 Tax=Altererythrobacter sp. ZODW24 TaxID=2185142 RepID=UPI000DF7754F|nr:NUDIX domain-containing protein [Altererythrobacter sp. ZODW24]
MEESTQTEQPKVIPAATVVIFRHAKDGGAPELLMVTRSRNMAFAAGMAVFPGGRVDPEDFELARELATELPEDEAAHRVAAIRETLEETGLAIGINGEVDAERAKQAREYLLETGALAPVLEKFGWQVAMDHVIPFARWYPKNEKLPRVFDTRFYLADLGTGAVDITVDQTENSRLFWASAAQALEMAEAGDIELIFPTRRNLERLAQFDDFAAAYDDCARYPADTIVPFMEVRDGKRWICIPDNLGYPVDGEPLDSAQRS